MGVTAVVVVGGIAAGVVVPFVIATEKAEEDLAKMTSIYLISYFHFRTHTNYFSSHVQQQL